MTAARKNVMLGTAGHVDHGKTALVKLLTGCDTDRLPEEKRRGLTIELGFAPCRMADERICGIVDVPGHVDFIRNMVAGAHGIDVVMLVIAADDSVMPQTREHLDILTLMGVRRGLVALTKIDLVDGELLDLVIEDVRQFVAGTFLEGSAICPISNVTGEGFDGFFAALNEAVSACEERESSGLFRLWVERVFNIRGFGTVLSGVPTSGEVSVGDRLRLLPGDLTGRVRGLQVYGEDAPSARAGECVAINLSDIDPDRLTRGKVLVEGDAFRVVSMAEGELRLLDHVPRPLKDYSEVHLYVGTAEVMGRVAILDGDEVPPGESHMVQLRLEAPLGVAPGDRFAIRAGMRGLSGGRITTIGGGRILSASDIRLRRKRPWTLEALTARRDAIDSLIDWCAVHLKEAREVLSVEALSRRAQRSVEHVRSAVEELKERGIAVEGSRGTVAHGEVVERAGELIAEALEAFHDANPTRAGIAEAELLGQVEADRDILRMALAKLLADEKVTARGEVVALAGRGAQLSADDRLLSVRIEEALREAGIAPPLPEHLASSLGADMDRFNAMVRLLADRATVVQLDRKVVMHRDSVDAAKKVALELFARSGGFETVDFRNALGVSRKFAVPLLDYFDTIRLTVRSGSRRTPGTEARKVLQAWAPDRNG